MVIPTYASIINSKKVKFDVASGCAQVDEHFLRYCMSFMLANVRVDDEWYLDQYPDVGAAIANGVISDCKTHFMKFGFYEHRLPHRIIVDESWYLRSYKDIREAVAKGAFRNGQEHFVEFGFREGRLPYANFSL